MSKSRLLCLPGLLRNSLQALDRNPLKALADVHRKDVQHVHRQHSAVAFGVWEVPPLSKERLPRRGAALCAFAVQMFAFRNLEIYNLNLNFRIHLEIHLSF